MQSFKTLSLVLAAAGLASAVPAASSRQFAAQITFTGAASSYTESIPADSTPVYFENDLAVDTITSEGGATCSFSGADGWSGTVVGANSIAVGPPQPIVEGSCLAL